MIQTCQGLDEDIGAFVAELVTSGSEEEQGFVQIKVIVSGISKR